MNMFAIVHCEIINDIDGDNIENFTDVMAIRQTRQAAINIAKKFASKIVADEWSDGGWDSIHDTWINGKQHPATDENLSHIVIYEEKDDEGEFAFVVGVLRIIKVTDLAD